MRIGKISAFGAAVSPLVFILGCCGTVCPTPATSPCDPRPAGQFGFMPTLPPPQSPGYPPAAGTTTGQALNHRLGGNMATNSSAVKAVSAAGNKYSTRFCLPSRSPAQAPARPSSRPVVSSVPAPAPARTTYGAAGDQPVTADITVQYPLPVPTGNLCAPGDGLGECYTLPESETPSASADGVELYIPGVVTSDAATTFETKAEETVEVAETVVVEEVVAPTGEVVETAEADVVAITPEQAADVSVTGSIAEAQDVDATVALVRPEAEVEAKVEVETPLRPAEAAEVEVAAPLAPPAPIGDQEVKLAEKAEPDTLAVEAAPVETAAAPAMPSAMEGFEDRAYLAMPRLPSEMSRDRAIVEDRLNTRVELDGLRAREDDTGIPMVELPPKLD